MRRHIAGDRIIGGVEPEPVSLRGRYDHFPIARADVFDVGKETFRKRELAVLVKQDDQFVRRQTRGDGVPQGDVAYAVGVDVLRAFFKLSKARQGVPGFREEGIVDF